MCVFYLNLRPNCKPSLGPAIADCTPKAPGTLAALCGEGDFQSDRLTLIWTGGEGWPY